MLRKVKYMDFVSKWRERLGCSGYFKILIFGLGFTCLNNAYAMQGGHGIQDAKWLQDLAKEMERAGENFAREREDHKRENAHQEEWLVDEIRNLKANGVDDSDPRIKQAERRIGELAQEKQTQDKIGDFGLDVVKGVWGAVLGDYNKEQRIEEVQRKALADGFMNNKGARERLQALMDRMKDPEQLLKFAIFAAGVTLGVVGVYYVVKLFYQYVEARMGKPNLVRESSIHGFKQALKKFVISIFSGEQDLEAVLSDIILSPDIQEKVYLLADDTKNTKEFNLPYQNVLFYGPPGTGKTEFAKILSRYSDMDYAVLSGADFSQFKNGEGITELHKLFEWANKSKRGLIIFIDEADACFRDRATLDKDGVNLVNAFLSHTGSSSDKFMIILATNYENELDAAVRSRIHKKVPFLLPALEERFKIFKLKLTKYVLNDKRAYYKEGVWVEEHLEVEAAVDDAFWREISTRTEGFSGRDIDQAIGEIRLRAYRSGANLVTKEIVETVIKDKIAQIKKDKESTEYQKQKFEHMFNIHKNDEYVLDSVKGEPAKLVRVSDLPADALA